MPAAIFPTDKIPRWLLEKGATIVYVEKMIIGRFRHMQDISVGPLHEPGATSELNVLAGANGSGKSSVLELLSYGLASRYSWQYYESRKITEHAFAIRIGLTSAEIAELTAEEKNNPTVEYAQQHRGYWMQVNMAEEIPEGEADVNERVHGLVSRKFRNFSRRLGFFVRSDRGYGAHNYRKDRLFNWRHRLKPDYYGSISYTSTDAQYRDMYEFLLEQSYHYVYGLGTYLKKLESPDGPPKPSDPLLPYNELMGKLFPGYSFADLDEETFALNVRLPNGVIIPFHDLSSGEKEVFFILSFFLRMNIRSSIIVIDEPELHLHPELARRFLRLLRTIRPGNQIWCATQSAELVDEAGRDRTFYLHRAPDCSHMECKPATSEEAHIGLLRDIFGYSGYVGIAGKIVFIEGIESSADRKAFALWFSDEVKDVKLIPVGSVGNLYRINKAVLALIEMRVAQCQFYLIRDHDYLSEDAVAKARDIAPGQLFVLDRYHIENYLLDEYAIADVLQSVYQQETDPAKVRAELLEIARQNSGRFLRDLVVFRFGELHQPEDCSIGTHSEDQAAFTHDGHAEESVIVPLRGRLLERMREVRAEVGRRTSATEAEELFGACVEEVRGALTLSGDRWKALFPGRALLQRFSRKRNLGEWPALQNLLIRRLAEGDIPVNAELSDIIQRIIGDGAG